jgi:beta-lactam-binding protein with PASTA domain
VGMVTGQVIGTTPASTAGPIPFGSKVTVSISLGPQPVVIPNVVGDSVAAATAALSALGLQVAGPYGPAGSTQVLSSDPAAGTSVQPGTTVNLYTL